MTRTLSRKLLVALIAFAGLASARADIVDVSYLVPVTYDMVITRPSSSSSTTNGNITTEQTDFVFEVFTSKDLLKLILGATTDAELKGWSLYARGKSSTFTDPDGLETLELVARKKNDAEAPRTLPSGLTFSISLSDFRAYSSSAVRDGSVDGTVLSKRDSIAQLATLTQAFPVRGSRSAGTLTTTGYIAHGLVLSKVTLGGQTTATAINRPTGATYRAAGTFNADNDSEDGLAEVLITFGAPTLKAVTD